MIGLGISTILIWAKFISVLNYFGIFWWKISNNIFGIVEDNNRKCINILFCSGHYNTNEIWMIVNGIIFLMFLIGIMLIIFNGAEKRAKLENGNKIFSNKVNENIIVSYLNVCVE